MKMRFSVLILGLLVALSTNSKPLMDCPNDPSISAMNYCLQQSYWPGTPGWDSCLAGYYGMLPMGG